MGVGTCRPPQIRMTETSVLSPEDDHDIDRAEWAAFVADGEALAGALRVEPGSGP